MNRARVLNCSQFPNWRWLEGRLPDHVNVDFIHVDTQPRNALEACLRRPYVARYRAAAQAASLLRQGTADVLVTHMPVMTTWTELFSGRRRVPHIAFSFNFTRLPRAPMRALMRSTLPKVDRLVVFSSMERELYAHTFGLDPSRIDVIMWGVQPPQCSDAPPLFDGDYLCAVGGEGRDYKVLMEAMRMLPRARAVIVTRPQNLAGLQIPPNVAVRTNLDIADVNNIVRHSRFMALPLLHSRVPCGHVTLVGAMHQAKALVITASEGVADYVRDGVNGLLAPASDPGALAQRIEALWSDTTLADRLGQAGLKFARTHCSEQTTIDYFVSCLRKLGVHRGVDAAPCVPAHAAPPVR